MLSQTCAGDGVIAGHGTIDCREVFAFLCLREVRRLINYLPSNCHQLAPMLELRDPADRIDPALDYLVPVNPNQSYDMNVLSILDGAEFMEIQPGFARNIICGFGAERVVLNYAVSGV